MDTFSARLASFDAVLKLEKRRSSTTKGSRVIAWPHQSPSPAELAHAGFYYKPYETNPDNTTCFHCDRALDGWEEEDNPITEHLKHSPECAWAIMMDVQQNSSNPATIEDPNSERIVQARIGTFGAQWPHDGKRGWLCQSQRMVEAGWYFCPNDDSDDLASCAYCKLSLDGWEPEDDPFDEHHRRSPDCSFFVFTQLPGKKGKGSKAKKGRPSKASSRLSVQSVASVASEIPDGSEMDVDGAIDDNVVSQLTSKTKITKKGSKSKTKQSKREDGEGSGQTDIDNAEHIKPEPPKQKRPGRPKKRVSEKISKDDESGLQNEATPVEEPALKRRATRTRSSSVSRTYKSETQDQPMSDATSADEGGFDGPKRGRKGAKKGSSKSRNVSDVSVVSKNTTRTRLPRDSELEAELAAGLETDNVEPMDYQPQLGAEVETELEKTAEPEAEPVRKKGRPAKKGKAGKKAKTIAEPEIEGSSMIPESPKERSRATTKLSSMADLTDGEEDASVKPKSSKTSKKKGTKSAKRKQELSQEEEVAVQVNESEHDEPEPIPEAGEEAPAAKPSKKKRNLKKEEKPNKAKQVKVPEPSPPPESPEDVRYGTPPGSSPSIEEFDSPDDLPDQIQVVPSSEALSPEQKSTHERTPVPPKTTKRFSDIPAEQHFAQSLTESHSSQRHSQLSLRVSHRADSPVPVSHQSTPSLSPQSSDAENRPPSALPQSKRPLVVASPDKHKSTESPRVAVTPSPSKRNLNAGFSASVHPWTPVDIEEVLLGASSDKENGYLAELLQGVKADLTSPEKRMTVEAWILWNAKNGEERLKRECERLVNEFEKQANRAMRRLEAIECID
ncbi:hypothetical protein N7539_002498 [Penicillium diatomitis]|uniref:Chromosome segregation protein BIR1 n=1 Tax=Penicillium diatomitis TaxID=2819901 RepID=A0A9X0BYQ5_9EURO|nr:uncharacterized protein N7539_002498 [Penicillium diatomitis]KAJ5490931.1 hypothetical protein N7539_002498 [Penicillium diatomitis]